MCHNHDYHPYKGDRMEKLPELFKFSLYGRDGFKLPDIDIREAYNDMVAHVRALTERMDIIENRLQVVPGWEAELNARLASVEERLADIKKWMDGMPLRTTSELISAPPTPLPVPDCSHAEDVPIPWPHKTPPTEGEAWLRVKVSPDGKYLSVDRSHKGWVPMAWLTSEINPADLVKEPPISDYHEGLEEGFKAASAAEQRLKDAMDEARGWYEDNKEDIDNGGVIPKAEITRLETLLARYGNKGGEK